MADKKERSVQEIQTTLAKNGIKLKEDTSIVRSVLATLCNVNYLHRVKRGVYILASQEHYQHEDEKTYGSDMFFTFHPTNNRKTRLSVNILENGNINLNGKLNSELNTRFISIQFTTNFKKIRLIPDGPSAHCFTKNGSCKNKEICNELRKHRINLPAHYEIEFDKCNCNYIGKLTP